MLLFQAMKPIAKIIFRFFLPMTLLSTLPIAACAYRVHREREVIIEHPRHREVIVEERRERPREEIVIEHR